MKPALVSSQTIGCARTGRPLTLPQTADGQRGHTESGMPVRRTD